MCKTSELERVITILLRIEGKLEANVPGKERQADNAKIIAGIEARNFVNTHLMVPVSHEELVEKIAGWLYTKHWFQP